MSNTLVVTVKRAVKKAVLPAFGPMDYDPAASALFAAMAVQPDATRKTLYNDLIVGLKDDGTYSLLDGIGVQGATQQQTGLHINNPSVSCSFVNSPTFLADRYVATNGTTSYIDLNINPSTATKLTRNSASFGVWAIDATTTSNSGAGWFNGTDGITIQFRNGSNQTQGRINSAGGGGLSFANTDGNGLFALNRSGANMSEHYLNGSLAASDAVTASTMPVNGSLCLGRITAATYTAKQFAAWYVGQSLDATQHMSVRNRLLTYLQGIGAV